MDPINPELQHPDFVWTWRESSRGHRQALWLPYIQSITKKPRSKRWILAWNGGAMETDLSSVDFIMIYGGFGVLPIEFLDDLNQQRVCLAVHRRNQERPYLFIPSSSADQEDILTFQLCVRSNEKSAAYVARTLIREKLASTGVMCPVSGADFKRLAASRNVASVLSIEAQHASRYWPTFYQAILGQNTPLPQRRECDHPINRALDAGSYFLHGVLLRWVLFHKLSPFHGYLHRATGYTSLVYDLLEPYRWWIDQAVLRAAPKVGVDDAQLLIQESIGQLKAALEEMVYVPATRQIVRRKSLLHGAVLGLRAWLLDKQVRLVIPVEGQKKGGRPPNLGFKIPGYTRPT